MGAPFEYHVHSCESLLQDAQNQYSDSWRRENDQFEKFAKFNAQNLWQHIKEKYSNNTDNILSTIQQETLERQWREAHDMKIDEAENLRLDDEVFAPIKEGFDNNLRDAEKDHRALAQWVSEMG